MKLKKKRGLDGIYFEHGDCMQWRNPLALRDHSDTHDYVLAAKNCS